MSFTGIEQNILKITSEYVQNVNNINVSYLQNTYVVISMCLTAPPPLRGTYDVICV